MEARPVLLKDIPNLSFQSLKLHVSIGKVAHAVGMVESSLLDYFSRFGQLDDLKVLRKRFLRRGIPRLRFRVLPGRNGRP